ncbi:MAG: T9SS type A sorting domain-containing protein [Candidatus Kapabacteria bacterium]|nr:T9SS type A sorting domain-containing protein [Candidatus Kapabacteria bacterium]
MKFFIYSALSFLSILQFSYAQRTPTGFVDYQRSSLSNPLNFGVTNTGIIGHNKNKSDFGLEFPRGSGNNYLFNCGLIFSALYIDGENGSQSKFAIASYNHMSAKSNMTPYLFDGVIDSSDYAKIYFSNEYQQNGIPLNNNGFKYPYWKQENNFDGIWVDNPSSRFPSSILIQRMQASDEDIICKYNDRDSLTYFLPNPDTTKPHAPFGLQVEQIIYTFNKGPLKNAMIVRNRLTNYKSKLMMQTSTVFNLDADVGKYANNNCARIYSKDTSLHLVFAWSGVDSLKLGYIGAGVLSTPLIHPVKDSVVKPGTIGAHYKDINFTSVNTTTVDTNYRFWLFDATLFPKSTPIKNKDVLLRSGYKYTNLFYGDTIDFAYAIVLANPTVKQSADGSDEDVEDLVQLFRKCKAAYSTFRETGILTDIKETSFNENNNVMCYPSPANEILYVNNMNGVEYTNVEVYDINGLLVATQPYSNLNQIISVRELPSGVYRFVLSNSMSKISILHPIVH